MVMVPIGRAAELPPGRMAEVSAAGRSYVICNVEGEFYALEGICPHRGAPLAHGALHAHTIVCPWHGWEFDCRSGSGDCADLRVTAVKVESGYLYLHAGTA
jgi:nitrite reductase (NADH) small subunit